MVSRTLTWLGEIADGDVDLAELKTAIKTDQTHLWEAVSAEEAQVLRTGRVTTPSPAAPPTSRPRRSGRAYGAGCSASSGTFARRPCQATPVRHRRRCASSAAGQPDLLRLVEALEQNLLEKAVLPALRTGVTAQLGALRSTTLPVRTATGLGQLADLRSVVETDGRERLARLVESLTTGSIGVAGPRGAGKTTLLTALQQGVIPAGGSAFRYRCLVSAPTRYDARDFLLHLTRQLCDAVLDAAPMARVSSEFPEGRLATSGPRCGG